MKRLFFYSFNYVGIDGQLPVSCSGTTYSDYDSEKTLALLVEANVPAERRHTVVFLAFNVLPD